MCKANAEKQTVTRGEPVIENGVLCVNMSGERDETRRFSNLIPELACLPVMNLCHTHMVELRRTGGDWTTVKDAAKRVAQQKKKNRDFGLSEGKVEESPLLAEIRKRYGG